MLYPVNSMYIYLLAEVMRLIIKLCSLFFIIVIFSCTHSPRPKTAQVIPVTPLSPASLWLTAHEDTLYRFLVRDTKTDRAEISEGGSMEYVIEGGTMGLLNDQIHNVGKCIVIYYVFTPYEIPSFEILLTTNYDTSCVKAVDSIFSDIPVLTHFRIKKYRPAGGLFSGFINGKDTVSPKDVAFKLTHAPDHKWDMTIYLRHSISDGTKEALRNQIFGEEVIVKTMHSISYKQLTDSINQVSTIEQIRSFFGIGGANK
jgi:hypothetical protein